MRAVATAQELEAIVGPPREMVLMKAVHALDDGCRSVITSSPVAAFGFRRRDGAPCSTFVGGVRGFACMDSEQTVSFDVPADYAGDISVGGVSMIFLLPGVGETLRLNGTSQPPAGTRLVVRVDEAFVHCAKCILRSQLWKRDTCHTVDASDASPTTSHPQPQLLGNPEFDAFLARSPFVIVSSWDSDGSSDTSPKGDYPGFVRAVDDRTVVIPDRKGNQRTDTFHNLMSCDDISMAAIVPGRNEVLHLSGTGYVTDDRQLLDTMAAGDRAPNLGLVIEVANGEFRTNGALEHSDIWDPRAHLASSAVPDLMGIAAQHVRQNTKEASAMTRVLSRTFAAAPKIVRRVADAEYRKDLRDEGRSSK